MKTLELNLPTPVLLAWGLPEDAKVTDNVISHRLPKCGVMHYTHLPEGNWQLIGKLSELTEEIIATFVEGNPASDTFCMSIEASGHHLANPVPEPQYIDGGLDVGGYDSKWIKEYEEAQSKTLPENTLIFKRV